MSRRLTAEVAALMNCSKVRSFLGFALTLLLLGVSRCDKQALPQREALAQISPVPAAPLPFWIASIAPVKHAAPGAQIRIRFKDDVIPVESLEAPERQAVLSHVRMDPPWPGRFLVLTPRMIGFQADAPLPAATRFRVTLTAGLADVRGHTLMQEYAWVFQTDALAISTDLPGGKDAQDLTPSVLQPEIHVWSNAELDSDSLAAHARLIDADHPQTTIGLARKVQAPPSPAPADQAPGEDQTPGFSMTLVPEHALEKARRYHLEIVPGVMPLQGNLPGSERVSGELQTFGPLALLRVDAYGKPDQNGANGRFASGAPELVFDNGLDAASAAQSISVEPAAAADIPLVHIDDGDAAVVLNPNALAPHTHYTITVARGLKDRFGQTLDAPVSATFDTGALAGDLWAPTGFTIFPAANDLALNVVATNLLEGSYTASYHVVTPEELVWADPTDPDAFTHALAASASQNTVKAPRADRPITIPVPLRERLGGQTGMLAYAISGRTNRVLDENARPVAAQPSFTGTVQLTNIGLFAQWFPDSAVVRTHHLSDGSPIVGAKIEIYPTRDVNANEKKSTVPESVEPCATGTADATGTLELNAAAFARCSTASTAADAAPSLLAVAHEGSDWAFVRTNDSSGAYQYGVWTAWSAGAPRSHGSVVPDRDLYQPGETVHAVAVGYFDTNGVLAKGKAASYQLTLEGPSGFKRELGSASLDDFGAFSLSVPLEKRQELGYYTLRAHAGNGEELTGTFRVAELKPPNFKVTLELERPYATLGQSVKAAWQSTYLFGAPVEGGTSQIDVTRSRTYFTPPAWEAFSFGRIWSYPEQEPSVPADVLQRSFTIPANGKNAQNIAVGGDLPYPMSYRVDAETTDVSNLSVADSKSFTVLPSGQLIGLQSDFVGAATQPHEVQVIVTNPEGQPILQRHVRVVLQERSYSSATQITEGSQTPVDSVHYTDVASVDVTSDQQPQKISLTPPKSGDYRIRANFVDAKSDVTATDAQLWVSGPEGFAWARNDDDTLSVKLDKAKYQVGETARVLVESPYPQAELMLAVVRHGVLFKQISLVEGSAPQASFTVTPDMLPNAAVEAVLVRRGAALQRGVPEGLSKLSRIGLTSFDVALDTKYVRITLSPEHDRIEPQQMQRVHVHVADAAGHGVRTELALGVVNDAILQLSGYRFPDLAQIVYGQQPISTRLADNRADVALATPQQPQEKGFGYGGGIEKGAAGTRVRTHFQPLAFYDGRIKTDAAGDADVSFTLPDDLTTWRVMAMSFSADARFGTADTTFIATKSLVTNALLPRFARPGDEPRGGVSVTDMEHVKGTAHIEGTLNGDLAFIADGGASPTTSLNAAMSAFMQAFRFDMRVTGSNPASVQFATALGDRRDAFREALDIRSNDMMESVVEVGTSSDAASIPFAPDARAVPGFGGLDLTLASTLLPETREAVRATLAEETPFAVPIASRVAVAADAILLDRRYGRTEDIAQLQAALAKNLDALAVLQRDDGGYARWPGARTSETFSSAFCAVSLAQARAAGADVARVNAQIERVASFLVSRLSDPSQEPGGKRDPQRSEIRLEALETLGLLGEVRDDHLSDIYAQRDAFSYIERLELARHLLRLPHWRAQGMALRDALFERVHLTGRAAVVSAPGSSLETLTAGQAQLVGLLVDSRANPEDIDRTYRSLLDLRRNGVWLCSCDAAEAMNATVAYASTQTQPPDFHVRASIGTTAFDARFHGYENTEITRHVPQAQLPALSSAIALRKTGTGTLHYVLVYRYAPSGEQPGVYAGIRLERIVHSPDGAAELARFGLARPAAALTFDAGHMFEIEDRITTDHPIDDVVVTDPLPAGFEAVDTTFQTTTRVFEPGLDNWQIDYQQIYNDRVLAFAQHLDSGVYAVHYLVRSVTPGNYAWPAAEVHPQYAPEDFGRTAAGRMTVR